MRKASPLSRVWLAQDPRCPLYLCSGVYLFISPPPHPTPALGGKVKKESAGARGEVERREPVLPGALAAGIDGAESPPSAYKGCCTKEPHLV